jgi:hypothetical protein
LTRFDGSGGLAHGSCETEAEAGEHEDEGEAHGR